MTIHKYLTELIEYNKTIKDACIKICIDYDKMIYIRNDENNIHYTYMNNKFLFTEYITLQNVQEILDNMCMNVHCKMSVLLNYTELEVYGNKIIQLLENIKLCYPNRHMKISTKIVYN